MLESRTCNRPGETVNAPRCNARLRESSLHEREDSYGESIQSG